MSEYMDDSMAETLGAQVGAQPGRVTWLSAQPGTGKSRVLAAFVRQEAKGGVRSFVWDPECAYGAGELPEGSTVLLGGAGYDTPEGLLRGSDEAGIAVLDSFSLLVPAGTPPEEFYYNSSGGLRGMAWEHGIAVIVAVQEPRGGWSPKHQAYSFLGEGFDGDRQLRLTPEGTLEVLRP